MGIEMENGMLVPQFLSVVHPTEPVYLGQAPRPAGLLEPGRENSRSNQCACPDISTPGEALEPTDPWTGQGLICRGTKKIVKEHLGCMRVFSSSTLAIMLTSDCPYGVRTLDL